jgi:hypothetical protein
MSFTQDMSSELRTLRICRVDDRRVMFTKNDHLPLGHVSKLNVEIVTLARGAEAVEILLLSLLQSFYFLSRFCT